MHTSALKRLSFFILLFAHLFAFAQNQVQVNTQVLPPFSPYLSAYVDNPNKLIVTLLNTSSQPLRIKLWVRISGDNGVSATTSPGYKPSQPIELPPFGFKSLDFNSDETKTYFDASHVDVVGISKAALIQNQALPEGNYTVCVRAFDYDQPNTPLSMEGAGCSASYPIYYIDAPQPIQPYCGNSLVYSTPQNIVFTWTPPATAPGTTQYEFTLKEVPAAMPNPADVIKNNVFPVLYSTTQPGANLLVYTNAMPLLEAGKKYVWRVRAVDPFNTVQFKNNGFSEPCWFTLNNAANTVTGVVIDTTPTTNVNIILLSPKDKTSVDIEKTSSTTGEPDHYLFRWKKPAYISGVSLSGYVLRIATVLAGQTPQQAFSVDSQVRTIFVPATAADPSYKYNNLGDFKPGTKYAWDVHGAGSGSLSFNKYYSDVWSFEVKKNYGTYTISGHLHYSYKLPAKFTWTPPVAGQFTPSSGLQVIYQANSSSSTTTSNAQTFPYANKKIHFYKSLLVTEGNNPAVTLDGTALMMFEKAITGKSTFADIGDWVGTTTTDALGYFKFDCGAVLGEVMDTTVKGVTYHYKKAIKISVSEDPLSASGKANPYVNNPDEYVIVEQQKNVEKEFYARVKSFNLNVTFKELPKKVYGNPTPPAEQLPQDVTIYVLRKIKYPKSYSPRHEALNNGEELIQVGGATYAVIDKKQTKTNQQTKFTQLVINDEDNAFSDKFYVYAKYPSKQQQIMTPVEYRTSDYQSCGYGGETTYQSSSDWENAYNKGCYDRKITIVPDLLTNCSLSGILKGRWNGLIKSGDEANNKSDQPLANTTVILIGEYVFRNSDGSETVAKNVPPSMMGTEFLGIFDMTTTDGAGQFKFNFNIYSDSSNKSTKLGYIGKHQGKDLYRVLRVVPYNSYYLAPDKSFMVDGGYQYEVGTLTCNVREWRIQGRVTKEWATVKNWEGLAGLHVYLCREKNISKAIPADEGNKNVVTTKTVSDIDGESYDVIAETNTISEGYFSFNRVTYLTEGNQSVNDPSYFVMVLPDELGTSNYRTEYATPIHPNTCSSCYPAFYNSQQSSNVPTVTSLYIEAKAMKPRIRGVLHPKSNMGFTTIADAEVRLYSLSSFALKTHKACEYDYKNLGYADISDYYAQYGTLFFENLAEYSLYKTQITGADGKFDFNNLPNGKIWLLWVKKAGFLDQVKIILEGAPLMKGQQVSEYLDLRLPVEVKVKVKDSESGTSVKAKIVVGAGYSWAKTNSVNCTYSSSGSYGSGQFQTQPIIETTCDEEATLLVPYGQVKLYVYPEDMTTYRADSFTVTIKSNTTSLSPLLIKKKRHEVSFYVYNAKTDKYVEYPTVKLINANVNNASGQSYGIGYDAVPLGKKNVSPYMEFESNATKFEFIVSGAGCTPKQISVTSDASKDDWTYVEVGLDPAITLKGKVMSGGKAIAGAKVFVDNSTSSIPIETLTDANGSYELNGVPMKNGVVIRAVKSPSNYVGDSYTGDFQPTNTTTPVYTNTAGNYGNTTVDFSNLGNNLGAMFGGTGGGSGSSSGNSGNNYSGTFSGGNGYFDYNTNWQNAGQNAQVAAWANTDNSFYHDFELVESNLDLSSFVGFAVEVTGMKNGTGTNKKVSGRLIELPGNSLVTPQAGAVIPFKDVEVKADTKTGPSGKPLMLPLSFPVQTSTPGISVKLYKNTLGSLWSPYFIFGGLQIDKAGNKGIVKGVPVLDGNSFPVGVQFDYRDILLEAINGPADGVIDAITSDKTNPAYGMQGFKPYNGGAGGAKKPVTFNLYGRYPKAEGSTTGSILKDDELKLDLTLRTSIANIDNGDIALKPGTLTVKTASISEFFNKTSPISMAMGKWTLSSSKWSLTKQGGLILKEGLVNTGVSVPFTNMSVLYNDLMFGEYKVENLKLGGLVDITVKPNSTISFGFDKGTYGGCWSLVILPPKNENVCSQFGPLKGMSGGVMKIASIRSFSKGNMNKIMLVNSPDPVTINGVSKFSAGTIEAGEGYITLGGAIDFLVPQLTYNTNFFLTYKKNTVGEVAPFFNAPGDFTLTTKGIKAIFKPNETNYKFQENLLQLDGIMKDVDPKNVYEFNVRLTKTGLSSSTVKLKTLGSNKFYYEAGGARYVQLDSGSMACSSSGWSNFAFGGTLEGMDGGLDPNQKKVKMTIKGDIVADPGNQIGVTKMEAGPLKNMSFVYDVNRKAMVGTAHLSADLGMQHSEMDMELLLGKSQWYLFGNGEITYPPDFLFKKTKAAFWVGATTSGFGDLVTNSFKSFSLDGSTLPANMTGSTFVGIVTGGSAKMPVPKIPQIDLNLGGFVEAGLDHEIGLNAVTSFKFDGLNSSLAFVAGGYVYLHAYAGASVVVGCLKASVTAKAQVEIAGSISKDHVSIGTTSGTGICLTGSAEIGGGCCDSDCDGYWLCPCISDGVSAHCQVSFGCSYENSIPPNGLGSFDCSISAPSCGTGGCN